MAKQSSSRLLIWLAALCVLIAVSVGVAVFLLMQDGGTGFDSGPKWLHVKLSDQLSDMPGNAGLLTDPSEEPPITSELSRALREAAADEDIVGAFVELGSLPVGWAQTQELRDALAAFGEADKPCIVWSEQYTTRDYYLATACDDLRLLPTGITLVNGMAMTQSYYASTLAELKIEPHFLHVGDFKSAVEPYERTGPSDPAAEATGALLDSLYDQLLRGIAAGRGTDIDGARALIDATPMHPEGALERGLVDKLQYRDEVLDEVGEERISLTKYVQNHRSAWRKGDKKVAVIYAQGTIISGESGSDFFGSSYIGDQTIIDQLEEVREDEDVAAVVLRVNSPGGSGSASDRMWRAVQLTRAEKPVVVSMGDYAASGGYYMSMGANRIFAEPGTLTGSIGVFGGKMDISGFYEEWLKVSLHTTQRGTNANLLSPTAGFDASGEQIYRAFLENFYTTFVTKAAEGRSMSYDSLHAVAQGRVWTGEQALERGLVDALGSTNDAIAAAAELASLDSYGVVRLPKSKSFLEQLMEELDQPAASARAQAELVASLPAPLRAALQQTHRLEQAMGGLDSLAPLALLPAELQIR